MSAVVGCVASSPTIEQIQTFNGSIIEQSNESVDSANGSFTKPVFNGTLSESSNLAIDSANGIRTVPSVTGSIVEQSDQPVDALYSSVPTVVQVVSTGTERLFASLQGSGRLDIDWGDGTTLTNVLQSALHTYSTPGNYTAVIVKVSGNSNLEITGEALVEVSQIGSNLTRISFYGTYPNNNLTTVVNYLPPSITNCNNMFTFATSFNSDISGWDVSNVTNMASMFYGTDIFNQDLSGWDVSNVLAMQDMFADTTSFNSDISGWDVSNVTNMASMFANATSFNQDLSGWCVSNFSSEPSFFSLGATSWVLPKPVWGTCPSG